MSRARGSDGEDLLRELRGLREGVCHLRIGAKSDVGMDAEHGCFLLHHTAANFNPVKF